MPATSPPVPGHGLGNTTPRARLTQGQLALLWRKAGGNPGWAPLMAAVAIAESGGHPTAAFNTTTGVSSSRVQNPGRNGATGLWQLEYPLWAKVAKVTNRTQLYKPLVNAKAAVRAWNTGRGTSNWWTPSNAAGQDPIIGKWKAAGSPRYPSELQVLTWLGQLGLENQATGAGRGSPSPKVGAPTATAGKGSNCGHPTSSTPTKPLCAIKLGPGLCAVNYCQLQAVKGGIIIVAGGIVMLVGVVVLAAAGFGKQAGLRRVQAVSRRVGLSAPPPRTREADRQERHATKAQLAGEPTPGGERLAAAEEPRRAGRDKPPVHTGPFDERDITPALSRRPHERRPRSTQHRRKART